MGKKRELGALADDLMAAEQDPPRRPLSVVADEIEGGPSFQPALAPSQSPGQQGPSFLPEGLGAGSPMAPSSASVSASDPGASAWRSGGGDTDIPAAGTIPAGQMSEIDIARLEMEPDDTQRMPQGDATLIREGIGRIPGDASFIPQELGGLPAEQVARTEFPDLNALTQARAHLRERVRSQGMATDEDLRAQDHLNNFERQTLQAGLQTWQEKLTARQQASADKRYTRANSPGEQLYESVVLPVTVAGMNLANNTVGAAGRLLDAWGNLPATAGMTERYESPFAELADRASQAVEANSRMEASKTKQPLFDENWNMNHEAALPQLLRTGTYMAGLMGAGAAAGAPGLVSASFLSTEEDYYREAREAGFSRDEAQAFSIAGAGLTSALELVNPQFYAQGTVKGQMAKRALAAMKGGTGQKQALKDAAAFVSKEISQEEAQEFSQLMGDLVVKQGMNTVVGEDGKMLDANTSGQEVAETMLVTAVMSGLAAGGARALDRPVQQQAMEWAARNPEVVRQYIQKGAPEDQRDGLLRKLEVLEKTYNGLPDELQKPGQEERRAVVMDAVAEKEEIKEQRSKSIVDDVLATMSGGDKFTAREEAANERIAEAMGVTPADLERKRESDRLREAYDKAKLKSEITGNPMPEGMKKPAEVKLGIKPEDGSTSTDLEAATDQTSAPGTPDAGGGVSGPDVSTDPQGDQPTAPERTPPVLTQDVPDDIYELANAYMVDRSEHQGQSTVDGILSDLTKGGVSTASYKRFGDPNNIGQGMAKQYLRKRGAGIDEIAMEASEMLGREVTTQDVVDFMNANPSGRPMRSERMAELDQRYGEITGKKLNAFVAKRLLAKRQKPKDEKADADWDFEEQAIVSALEDAGVPIEEIRDEDINEFDSMSDADADAMFGGGSTIAKFDLDAGRRKEQVQQGATRADAGTARAEQVPGARGEAEAEFSARTKELTEERDAAQRAYDKAFNDFNKRGQSLFDENEGSVAPALFEGDTRQNAEADFERIMAPHQEKLDAANRALTEHFEQGDDFVEKREKELEAQTSIDEPALKSIADRLDDLADRIDKELGGMAGVSIIPPKLLSSAFRATATAIRGGQALIAAIEEGLKVLRASKWYQALSGSQQQQTEAEYANMVNGKMASAVPPKVLTPEEVQKVMDKQREDAKSYRKSWGERAWNWWTRHFEDAKAPMKRLLKQEGAMKAVIKKNLTAGATGLAKQKYTQYRKKIHDGLNTDQKKVLDDLIQLRRTINIDTRYDGILRPRKKHPGGTNKESAENWMMDLAQKDPKLFKDLNKRADAYFKAMGELLELKHTRGLISDELYDDLRNDEYSPREFLHHLIDSEQRMTIGSTDIGGNGVKHLMEGSEESMFNDSEWLLANHVASTYKMIFNNEANQALAEAVSTTPQIGYELKNNEEPKPGYEAVKYYEDGKQKQVAVINEIAVPWSSSDPIMKQEAANTARVLSGGAFKRMVITGLNPAFALANFPRDVGHVLMFTNTYSQFGPRALGQLGADIRAVTKDAWGRKGRYLEYLEEGGSMDFLTRQGRPLTDGGVKKQTMTERITDGLFHYGGYVNETSELMVRLAIREREIKNLNKQYEKDNGKPPTGDDLRWIKQQATARAREQMDFNQGGDYAKAADNFILYFNAALQGTRVMARYIKENPAKFGVKLAQLGSVAVALTMYNMGFDEWDEIEDHVKENNFIFFLPLTKKDKDGNQRRRYITIPKSQDQRIFASFFEGLAEFTQRGKWPTKRSVMAINEAIPVKPWDAMDVPILDAMYSYGTGFDRFQENYVIDPKADLEKWAEFTEGKTDQLYRDIGKMTASVDEDGNRTGGLSPARLKLAMGKYSGLTDGNVFHDLLVGKSYNTIREALGKEGTEEFQKNMGQHAEDMAEPFVRRYMRWSNPNAGQDIVERHSRAEQTRRKLLNDVVKKELNKYKAADTEQEREAVIAGAQMEINKMEEGDRKRATDRFVKGVKNIDVPYFFIELSYAGSPQAKAQAFLERYRTEDEAGKTQMIEHALKVGVLTESVVKEMQKSEAERMESVDAP